jgi:oligopeptide/dipeptide ABC transporter ATP-binding protein
MADRVVVMYAGRVVEQGDVDTIFNHPAHPYTAGLLGSLPQSGRRSAARLVPIAGAPPSIRSLPSGCSFHPRCPLTNGRAICREQVPQLVDVGGEHVSACHFASEMSAQHADVARSRE